MALIDRDYMHRTGHKRPFSPPPKRAITGWLGTLLIFACIVYLGFKLLNWLDDRAKPAPAAPFVNATPAIETTAIHPAVRSSLAPIVRTPPMQVAPAEPGIVTKCVTNGKTSYSDGPCDAGAVASRVDTKTYQSRMVAVTAPPINQATAPVPVLTPAPTEIAQANPGLNYYAAIKAECASLEARIKYLDDFARQPQSAQTQDWIKAERKQARDRQFRIRCQ